MSLASCGLQVAWSAHILALALTYFSSAGFGRRVQRVQHSSDQDYATLHEVYSAFNPSLGHQPRSVPLQRQTDALRETEDQDFRKAARRMCGMHLTVATVPFAPKRVSLRASSPCASGKLGGGLGVLRGWNFTSNEVEIPTEDGTKLRGYMTESMLKEGEVRTDRSVLLLPGEHGFDSVQTRKLADRLAFHCSAIVLVPDLLDGAEPLPESALPPDETALAEWSAGALPPQRVARALRSSMIYLRADQRVGRIALLGASAGAQLVLRALAKRGSTITAGVAFCPPSMQRDVLENPDVPLCLLLDRQDYGKAAIAHEYFNRSRTAEQEAKLAASSIEAIDLEELSSDAGAGTKEIKVEAISKLKRLRVGELRERLAVLGAFTDGRKPELVERLHQMLRQLADDEKAAAERAATEAKAHQSSTPERSPWLDDQEKIRSMVHQFTGLRLHFANTGQESKEEDEDDRDTFFAKQRKLIDEQHVDEEDEIERAMIVAESFLNYWLEGTAAEREERFQASSIMAEADWFQKLEEEEDLSAANRVAEIQ